jgi:uncharacterized repeat protein (TIGR03803 family)
VKVELFRGIMRKTLGTAAVIAAALAFVRLGAPPASGQTLQALHNFCARLQCADGSSPNYRLTRDSDGVLYGTTGEGGVRAGGVVFALFNAGSGWKSKVLYNFCADGTQPQGSVIVDTDGNIYGTTFLGGANGAGTVYELTHDVAHDTWTESVVYNFCSRDGACTDGMQPLSGLTYAGASSGAPYDGTSPLYGTTVRGGANLGGVVYALTPHGASWSQRVLHAFCGTGGNACTDGMGPVAAPILDSGGNLYGTTQNGGAHALGAAYKLTPDGGNRWTETVLRDFCSAANCADGSMPQSELTIDAAGDLLGVAPNGGDTGPACGNSGCGVLYEIAGNGTYSVLHTFCATDCRDGAVPLDYGGLVPDGFGNLYGTTNVGGGHKFAGTVFKFDGTTLTTVKTFCPNQNCAHGGSHPRGGVILDPSANIYGTTVLGGKYGQISQSGTVFKITP